MFTLSPGWELEVDRGPDWLMVKVGRPQESAAAPVPLAEVLWSLLERHLTHRLVVDLGAIRCFDEDLLEQLLELYTRVSGHGGVLRVCGLSPYNRRILLERHLDDRLVPYSDIGNAVLGHSMPRQPR